MPYFSLFTSISGVQPFLCAGCTANARTFCKEFALEQAERRTVLAQKVAEEAAIHAAEKMEEMRKAGIGGEDSVLKNLKTALRAREKAVEAAQKVVREQRKSTEVARDLESRGILPKSGDE